jgi:hypothetical protein
MPQRNLIQTSADSNIPKVFEKAIFKKDEVNKKDLYEYKFDSLNTNQTLSIRAFRKYGFGGVGNYHTFVTQFPFNGHN